MKTEKISTDVLIIGGGTAGCYAALTISENSDKKVLICEKAHIKRSGCLAAGVNALNAYIVEGRKPQDYVDYAKKDADGIVREDLLLTMSEKLNEVTDRLEKLGLVILKDENGKYVTRGNRNLKINGENIKPILADAVEKAKNVTVLNRVNIFDYSVKDNKINGAFGFGIESGIFYTIEAKAVIIATGGAAGLYKPNNPGFSRHKMWYPPFNTGAGYAMGIRAGAEMTTFEMRFIALRCKDTIAPTGTLAQGVGAKQINSLGEVYETKYGLTTSERVYGTVNENQEGRGPCYLRTEGITVEQDESLLKAYLNMAPSQTIKWIESGRNPSRQNVEIEGTEPYIVGGHTASGYWVDTDRATTIEGLFAGLIFVLTFGRQSPIYPLLSELGIKVIFAVPGIILATVFVTFPFISRELIPVLESEGTDEEEAAALMGAKGTTIFRKITFPHIKWAFLYGVVLCAARAMGEFGAVSVISGHLRGKTNTLPLHVEILFNEFKYVPAFAVSSILVLMAIAILIIRSVVEYKGKKDA